MLHKNMKYSSEKKIKYDAKICNMVQKILKYGAERNIKENCEAECHRPLMVPL